MLKPILFVYLLLSTAFFGDLRSQEIDSASAGPLRARLPGVAVKTNLLYDLSTTISLGGEFRLSDYLTLDVPVSYNPWTFGDNRKFKHILVQPELRYWVHEPFNGHFLGAHLLYSHYNAGNLPFGSLRDSRYQGDAYGLGFSYGYQWILSPRWNLEATLGVGYAHLDYSRYECRSCGAKTGEGQKSYFGATKAGISLVYILR